MTGFSNPIVNPQGKLVIPQVMSPNFNLANPAASPNPSWAILKNGLAYFFGLVLAGGTIVGPDYILDPTGFYFYEGAPALGNLAESVVPGLASVTDPKGNTALPGVTSYFNALGSPQIASQSFAGNTIYYQWTGTTWSGSASIFADFSTGLLEIVGQNGIKITGPITGPVPGLDLAGPVIFESTMTLKNGASSSTIAIATDGHPKFSQEIELSDTAPPPTPATGVKLYSANGHLKTQSEDGVAYATESIRVTAAGQTVSSLAPTFVNLTGLLLPLGIGTYQIRIRVFINANASAGQWQILITAPAGATGNYSFKWESAAGVSGLNVNRTAFAVAQGGPSPSVAGAYWATIEGVVTLTVAGNINVKGATTVAVDTFDIETGSYAEAFPVI